MMANSLINSIAMIDHDLMAKLKEILAQGKLEKAIEARAHLLLAHLQFFRTPASRSEGMRYEKHRWGARAEFLN